MAVSKNVSLCFFGLVVINLAVGAFFFFGKEKPRSDLSAPSQAVESLSAKSLYFTPAARAYLLDHRPELVPADLKNQDSEQTLHFAQAAQDPTLWRKLARDLQFDTALLTGEPGDYRPLLRHLLASKDWTLAYLDHTSLVFKHLGDKSWIPEDLNGVLAKFSKASSRDRATVLAQLANKLLEITQYAQAKKCLDQALDLDKKQPEIWTAKALYQLHFGQWPQALDTVNKALELDADFLPALSAKAHLLFTLRRFQEALPVSERLVKASPTNPQVLLLHAKIAHEIENYRLEAETLQSIIDLAEQQHTSTTGYRLFLAQAYAHNGNAIPALEQFQRVLNAPDITEDQRKSVDECVATIREKIQSAAQDSGGSSTSSVLTPAPGTEAAASLSGAGNAPAAPSAPNQ